jgi:hypothetical protein
MGVTNDFNLFCDLIGIPISERSKQFHNLKIKAAKLAEIWVAEEYENRGFQVIHQNQRRGGFDFYLKKVDHSISYDLLNKLYIEVKINTSGLTKKQRLVRLQVIENGGDYRIIRHNIPLMISDWLTWPC